MQGKFDTEMRFISFIDILGFKDIVLKSENSKKIMGMVDYLYKMQQKVHHEDFTITWFSDSLVLSINAQSIDNLLFLINTLQSIQSSLINSGVLLRGALTIGDCYHKDNNVYGKAMVEAYELESKAAITPRIILSKSIMQYISKTYSDQPEQIIDYAEDSSPDNDYVEVTTHILTQLISKDSDGYFYILYLEELLSICVLNYELHASEKYSKDYYKRRIDETIVPLRNLINKELKSPMYISLKYVWLKDYYNKALKSLDNNLNSDYYKDFHDIVFQYIQVC